MYLSTGVSIKSVFKLMKNIAFDQFHKVPAKMNFWYAVNSFMQNLRLSFEIYLKWT